MPHGITQCYLPPGRGDIPALTLCTVFQKASPIALLKSQSTNEMISFIFGLQNPEFFFTLDDRKCVHVVCKIYLGVV